MPDNPSRSVAEVVRLRGRSGRVQTRESGPSTPEVWRLRLHNTAKTYLLLISMLGGASVLALEVLSARAIAPAMGSGPVCWSALLAVALGTLAAGNLLGGLLRARAWSNAIIAWSLVIGSASVILLSLYHAPAMRWSAGQPLLAGALAAAAITQAVPLCMLGTITPVILRQGSRRGPWAGLVLAAGSSGGIAGALAAGLFLLPTIGLTRSYLAVAALLAVSGMPAILFSRRWLAGLAASSCLVLAIVCWCRHEPGGTVHSQHGQLEIEKTDTGRVLLIDGLPQTGLPDVLRPGDGLWYGYLLETSLMMGPQPDNALVVGLGAGLAPRLLSAHGIDCRTVEIDPAVVEIARNEFGFTGPITLADGRAFLSQSTERWDLIFLDVCTSDRLAWHLFTVEAMQTVHDRLSTDGVLVIQFIGDDGPWSASLFRSTGEAFDHTLMLKGAGQFGSVGPRWLFAARHPLLLPDELFGPRDPSPWESIRPTEKGRLLTDDHFSTESEWARTAVHWRSLYCVDRSADR